MRDSGWTGVPRVSVFVGVSLRKEKPGTSMAKAGLKGMDEGRVLCEELPLERSCSCLANQESKSLALRGISLRRRVKWGIKVCLNHSLTRLPSVNA